MKLSSLNIDKARFLLLASSLTSLTAAAACTVESTENNTVAGAGNTGTAGSSGSTAGSGGSSAGSGGAAAGAGGATAGAGGATAGAGGAAAGAGGATAGAGGATAGAGGATAGAGGAAAGAGGAAAGAGGAEAGAGGASAGAGGAAAGAGGAVSCDDSTGTPGACGLVCNTWGESLCAAVKTDFKPTVAETAVACMTATKDEAACDGKADPYQCMKVALAAACPDASADAACATYVEQCKGTDFGEMTIAECHALLDGTTEAGRAKLAKTMGDGCYTGFGLFSAIESL